MTQEEMKEEMMDIRKFFEDNNIKKIGPVVTATYGVQVIDGKQVLDMEIFIPMDKIGIISSLYTIKPQLIVGNALYTRHQGAPEKLPNTYNEIVEYIKSHKLQPNTPLYNVEVSAKPEMIIDLYVGIS